MPDCGAWQRDGAVCVEFTLTAIIPGLTASYLTSDFFCNHWAYYDVLSSSTVSSAVLLLAVLFLFFFLNAGCCSNSNMTQREKFATHLLFVFMIKQQYVSITPRHLLVFIPYQNNFDCSTKCIFLWRDFCSLCGCSAQLLFYNSAAVPRVLVETQREVFLWHYTIPLSTQAMLTYSMWV